jgi:pimeloyl-[acyl-carrier protein] methyl ester esterase
MTHDGAKQELFLIHGWGLGCAAWDAAFPALAQRFNVQRLALPGYGAPCSGPHPSFADTAAALAETVPAGAYVGGWSLGAMLALQIATLAPQRLAGLILVGATPSFTQRADWTPAQPPALLETFRGAIEQDVAGTLQRFIALLNQGDTQARPIGRALNKQLQSAPLADRETLLAGLGWLRDVDLRKMIPAINTPTLLIHGENDPLMPLAAACWLNENLPGAQLQTIAGAAHAPFLNDPERFANLIGEYCHAAARH